MYDKKSLSNKKHHKMIKTSSLIFCFIFFVGHVISQSVPIHVINDQLHPALSSQLHGFVGKKLDSSYKNRILAQDVDRLISPFQNRAETRCWQSEFWGKWFTSAVLAYRYRPEPQLKKVFTKD